MSFVTNNPEFNTVGIQELSLGEIDMVAAGAGDAPGEVRDIAVGAGAAFGSRFGNRGAVIGGYLGGAIFDLSSRIDISTIGDHYDTKLGINSGGGGGGGGGGWSSNWATRIKPNAN